MTKPKLYVKRLYDDAHLPKRATRFSAGYDLYAYLYFEDEMQMIVEAGKTVLIPTGLEMRPDEDYCIKLFPRSGLALNHNITLGNCVGLGDADYFKPYGVIIHNHGSEDYIIYHEERICQIKVERVEDIHMMEVKELPPLNEHSTRDGGFGHSGTHEVLDVSQIGSDFQNEDMNLDMDSIPVKGK